MKHAILKDMDNLKHNKESGFYDPQLDAYFNDLTEWLKIKHNKTWNEVL